MRICVINNVPDEPVSRAGAQTMIEACAKGVLRTDTQIYIRGLSHAPADSQTSPECYRDSFYQLLSTVQFVKAAIEAQRQGFDAVIMNCFDDLGVEQARSVVDIPVVGIGSASLFFAAQLGRRIGLIVPNLPGQIQYAERQIADLRLSDFFLPNAIRTDGIPFAESWCQALADPKAAIERFEPIVIDLLREGAESVIFGCGGFSLVCGAHNYNRVLLNGRTHPLVIPITVALQRAESLVLLHENQRFPVDAPTRGSMRHSAARTAELFASFGLPKS